MLKFWQKEKKTIVDHRIMCPVKKWHTNETLRGWDAEDGKEAVNDLSITTLGNNQGILSIWKIVSIWQRVKFLIHGEITFQVHAKTHPPVQMYCGDVVIRLKEEPNAG